MKKKFPLPEFILFDGENHLGEQLEARTVLMHLPTHSIFEVVAVFPEEMNQYKSEKQFGFVFKNGDGEDENHLLLLHSTHADEETLADVQTKAAKWYSNYALWIDDEINNM